MKTITRALAAAAILAVLTSQAQAGTSVVPFQAGQAVLPASSPCVPFVKTDSSGNGLPYTVQQCNAISATKMDYWFWVPSDYNYAGGLQAIDVGWFPDTDTAANRKSCYLAVVTVFPIGSPPRPNWRTSAAGSTGGSAISDLTAASSTGVLYEATTTGIVFFNAATGSPCGLGECNGQEAVLTVERTGSCVGGGTSVSDYTDVTHVLLLYSTL